MGVNNPAHNLESWYRQFRLQISVDYRTRKRWKYQMLKTLRDLRAAEAREYQRLTAVEEGL